jgi:ribosomal protein S18 acetylase RimI-like enzyme
MFEVKILKDKQTAIKIGQFLTSSDAFDQTWAPNEKVIVEQSPVDSLTNSNHRYWYVENNGQIIGAMGIRENKYGSGGYEMDSDYMAVHKDYRRQGIASALLTETEKYVIEKRGRYVHIVTCDIDSYKPALAFYEKYNYKKVAEIPDYYIKGEGRMDYIKFIT